MCIIALEMNPWSQGGPHAARPHHLYSLCARTLILTQVPCGCMSSPSPSDFIIASADPILITAPEPSSSDAHSNKEIKVYSDSSAHGSKVGMAAILSRGNNPDHILHFYLGRETEHMVHEAELVGLFLALHLIHMEKRSGMSCSIAVDNQATLKAFNLDLRKPGHHLVQEAVMVRPPCQNKSIVCLFVSGIQGSKGDLRDASEHLSQLEDDRFPAK